MSKLEQLIQKLCPDGVEYKELGEVCENISTGKLNANANVENGKYPFFTCDKKPLKIDNYAFDTTAILISGNGSQVGHINMYSGKFNAYQRTYVLSEFKEIDIFFIYHYLRAYLKKYIEIHSKKGSVPYITLPVLQRFKIPIPPIEIQEEIVRILDRFTELTTELELKLTEEFTARKKQYEYYRDKLLNFKLDVKHYYIGELFDFKNGLNKEKSFFGKGKPIINYMDVYKKNKLYLKDIQGLVDISISDLERYNVKKGDVFFTRTSETKEEIGITSVLMEDIEDAVFSGFILRARPKTDLILPEYCAYCFSSTNMRKQIIKYSTYTTRALTNGTNLSKIEIPLPPLEIQQKIVDVLDNFETICNDLNIGLPAEIEARKKQYEYYRDKLLDFVEFGTVIAERERERERERD